MSLCLASLTTLHLQVPCKLHDCPAVRDHDVPVLINSACLDSSELDLSTRQVVLTVFCFHHYEHLSVFQLSTINFTSVFQLFLLPSLWSVAMYMMYRQLSHWKHPVDSDLSPLHEVRYGQVLLLAMATFSRMVIVAVPLRELGDDPCG